MMWQALNVLNKVSFSRLFNGRKTLTIFSKTSNYIICLDVIMNLLCVTIVCTSSFTLDTLTYCIILNIIKLIIFFFEITFEKSSNLGRLRDFWWKVFRWNGKEHRSFLWKLSMKILKALKWNLDNKQTKSKTGTAFSEYFLLFIKKCPRTNIFKHNKFVVSFKRHSIKIYFLSWAILTISYRF